MREEGDWTAPRALYVHVPLCRSKCYYCDFYSLPCDPWSEAEMEELVGATLARVDDLLGRFPPSGGGLETCYVGGGTPSVLPLPALRRLLEGLARRLPGVREWTMEANPESLSDAALDMAAAAGVNRLSIGVQSLDDELLARLGRPASSGDCLSALHRAVRHGGFVVSADLIAGLPRRRPLREEVARLLDSGIRHLSMYDLSLERGTRLAAEVAAGSFVLPDEDLALDERDDAEVLLADHGCRRYEVSNWAAPGDECLHNLVYWRMDSWVGAGPGAVSTLARSASKSRPSRCPALRIEETRDAGNYASPGAERAVETGLCLKDSLFETILMGFRTAFGVDEQAFFARYGLGLPTLLEATLGKWADLLVEPEPWPLGPDSAAAGDGHAGLGTEGTSGRALGPKGLDLLNRFLVDCLAEIEARKALFE